MKRFSQFLLEATIYQFPSKNKPKAGPDPVPEPELNMMAIVHALRSGSGDDANIKATPHVNIKGGHDKPWRKNKVNPVTGSKSLEWKDDLKQREIFGLIRNAVRKHQPAIPGTVKRERMFINQNINSTTMKFSVFMDPERDGYSKEKREMQFKVAGELQKSSHLLPDTKVGWMASTGDTGTAFPIHCLCFNIKHGPSKD